MVSQGLASSPSQQAPSGAQPQVGNTLPEGLLFVKLPDRIVLIDPETKLVTEIVMDATTTGSNPSSSSTPFRKRLVAIERVDAMDRETETDRRVRGQRR
jgi:hypothetical protein